MLGIKLSGSILMLPIVGYFLSCILGGMYYIYTGLSGGGLIGAGVVGVALAGCFHIMKSAKNRRILGIPIATMGIFAMYSWIFNLPWDYEPIYDVATAFALLAIVPIILGFVMSGMSENRLSPDESYKTNY